MSSRVRMWALALAGLVLWLLVVAELQCHLDGAVATIGSEERLKLFLAFESVAALVYFAVVWLVRSGRPPRGATAVVVFVALAMRVVALASPPFLSSDLFRYVWDGKVQLHRLNPYVYLPAAPQLAFLRDPDIYENINRADEAPTIYPPAAQLIFAGIAWVWPSITMVKLVMLGFEAVVIGAVAVLLRRAGQPAAGVVVYAWNPLPIWEYAGNGHIDAAALGFIALALLAASVRWRAAAGGMLGLAILCKLLPAALFPAFWRRWDWRTLAATLAVVVALYGLYTAGAGWRVLGYLPGYAAEEGIDSGTGFFLLRAIGIFVELPPWATLAYLAVAAAGLLGLAARYALGPMLPRAAGPRVLAISNGAAVLALATTIALSPHYPWYLGWLALLGCFVRYRSVIYMSASGVLLYMDPYHRETVYPWLVYGPTIALALMDWMLANRLMRSGAHNVGYSAE